MKKIFPYVPSKEAKEVLEKIPKGNKTEFINSAVIAAGSKDNQQKAKELLKAALNAMTE